MVTKTSTLSKKVVKEVQNEVNDRLQYRYNIGGQSDLSCVIENGDQNSRHQKSETALEALQSYN